MMAQWQMQPMVVVMPNGSIPAQAEQFDGYRQRLNKAAEGIKYEYYTAPGGHTWYTWRNNLHQLAQRLFK